jgi:purine-binding chemotaxis protein CheW
VETIVRAVAVMPLPGAPEVVLGVINFRGRILPVIKLRRRCGLPEREMDLTDQMIIAHSSRRQVALLVDATEVITCPAEAVVPSDEVFDHVQFVHDVVKQTDGTMIPLFNPDTFLSSEEQNAAETATKRAKGDSS